MKSCMRNLKPDTKWAKKILQTYIDGEACHADIDYHDTTAEEVAHMVRAGFRVSLSYNGMLWMYRVSWNKEE